MLVSVIGPAALVSDRNVDVLPRRQERQVLAALAIDPRRTWRVDELAEALWPDGAVPAGAGKLVRNVVSRLRSTLGTGAIDSESDGYRVGSHVRASR